MSENGIKRQLKAIFSAAVKGYSKLMGDDDEATVQTITAIVRSSPPALKNSLVAWLIPPVTIPYPNSKAHLQL